MKMDKHQRRNKNKSSVWRSDKLDKIRIISMTNHNNNLKTTVKSNGLPSGNLSGDLVARRQIGALYKEKAPKSISALGSISIFYGSWIPK